MEKNSEKKMPDLRLLSLDIVIRTMDREEYYDKVLHEVLLKYSFLDLRSRSFITRLSGGTVERAIELDYIINSFLDNKRIKPVVRNILRLGVYQIIYMDSVPDFSAVDECVKLAVKKKVAALKGLINAVLRNVIREGLDLKYPDKKEDEISYLSVWYSMPKWIVKYMLIHYKDKTESILKSFFDESHHTTVRVNTSLSDVNSVMSSLENEGAKVKRGEFYDYALKLSGFGRITELTAFKEGFIQVQDESSMTCGAISKAEENMEILDMCAAPGGKSIHLSDIMKGTGKIIACDIHKNKVTLIRENLIRIGTHNVKLKKYDSTKLNDEWKEKFDIVVCDVPCSGLGVLKKKADIKYKLKKKDIMELQDIQRQILKCAVKYVKPGGTLIYSTCTIIQEENEDNMYFIRDNYPFTLSSIENELPDKLKNRTGHKGYIQILPSDGDIDGFFVAKFIKKV